MQLALKLFCQGECHTHAAKFVVGWVCSAALPAVNAGWRCGDRYFLLIRQLGELDSYLSQTHALLWFERCHRFDQIPLSVGEDAIWARVAIPVGDFAYDLVITDHAPWHVAGLYFNDGHAERVHIGLKGQVGIQLPGSASTRMISNSPALVVT